MMIGKEILLPLLAGYLLGSIPIGYLVGKMYGVDVRQVGSGRTGGTNVFRAAGLLPAAITILGDALKGIAAVGLAWVFTGEVGAAMAGIGAVAGHNWPLFLGWKGGAGGVTAAAVVAALNPICGAVVAILALSGIALSRYASVATLVVALLSPIALLVYGLLGGPMVYVAYGLAAGAMIVCALLPNIARLKAGTERKINI